MAHIIINQNGFWSIHDDRMNYSKDLTAEELEKLTTEFPGLKEDGRKVFSTERVKSIPMPIFADEFWAMLQEALGPDMPLIIEYDDPEKAEPDGPQKYEVSFFQYSEEQKARLKAANDPQNGTNNNKPDQP